jgi:hypothetical protein
MKMLHVFAVDLLQRRKVIVFGSAAIDGPVAIGIFAAGRPGNSRGGEYQRENTKADTNASCSSVQVCPRSSAAGQLSAAREF